MSILDIIYLLMLILSIPLGHIVKSVKKVIFRQLICLGAGLFIVFTLVGWKASWHSFFVIVGNYFIIQLPKFG